MDFQICRFIIYAVSVAFRAIEDYKAYTNIVFDLAPLSCAATHSSTINPWPVTRIGRIIDEALDTAKRISPPSKLLVCMKLPEGWGDYRCKYIRQYFLHLKMAER